MGLFFSDCAPIWCTENTIYIILIDYKWLCVCQMGTLFDGRMLRKRKCHTFCRHWMGFWMGCQDLLMEGRGGDLILFQFAVEGIAADAQAAGGFFFIPAALYQYFSEQPGFVFHHGARGTCLGAGILE